MKYHLETLLEKQKDFKRKQTTILQVQVELKDKFMATEINKISKFHKAWMILKEEGISSLLKKLTNKIKQKFKLSKFGSVINLEKIKKYTVLDTPQKIKFNFLYSIYKVKDKSRQRDSNTRHWTWKDHALPTELYLQKYKYPQGNSNPRCLREREMS